MSHNVTRQQIQELLGFRVTPGEGGGAVFGSVDESQIERALGTNRLTRYSSRSSNLPLLQEGGEDFVLGGGRNLSRRHRVLNEIRDRIDLSKDMESDMADLLGSIEEGAGTSSASRSMGRATRVLERANRDFSRSANNFYKQATDLIKKHKEAGELAKEALFRLQSEVAAEHTTARANIATRDTVTINRVTVRTETQAEKEAARTILDENNERIRSRINQIRSQTVDAHEETITELKSMMTEVEEKTKIKPPSQSTLSEIGKDTKADAVTHDGHPIEVKNGVEPPKGPNKLVEGLKIGAGVAMVYDGATNPEREGWMKAVEIILGGVVGGHGAFKLLSGVNKAVANVADHASLIK